MVHCVKCGGAAVLGLAHIHGNPLQHLCKSCSSEVTKNIKTRLHKTMFIILRKAA
jgi:hypothetical protein